MKYKVILVINLIILFTGCDDMRIDSDFQRTYIETFTRTVGATERTGARGTLPQPTPTDLNAIWLAPNGNDGAAGTQAAPKLTLNGAIAALAGAKATVHIFRNSYVGDLIFNETVVSTLGVGFNIQCEEGEIAYIVYDLSATTTTKLTLSGTNKLNGLYIIDNYLNSTINGTATVLLNSSTLTFDIENCTIEEGKKFLTEPGASGFCIINTGNNNAVNIKYSTLINYRGVGLASSSKATFENNIFINNSDSTTVGQGLISSGAIVIYTSSSTPQNLVIDRCLFSGFRNDSHGDPSTSSFYRLLPPNINCLGFTSGTDPSAQSITINSTHIFNSDNFVLIMDSYAAGRNYKSITFNNCLSPISVPVTSSTGTMPANITWVVNDPVSTLTPILFQDELDFINNNNIESARLQHEGQATPDGSGKYFLTSPLVGAGLAGDDISPFDESVVFASQGFNKTLEIIWPPDKFNFEFQLPGSVNNIDVNGNLHRKFDKKRRSFQFTFGEGIQISNIQLKKMQRLTEDNGSKKLYPIGFGANLFAEDTSSTGIFSNADNSIAPTDALSTAMVPGWWAGFWINIEGDEYYIDSNDELKLYLLDKLDNGYPANGNRTFIIESILVNMEAAPFAIRQSNFTSFRDGGFLREDDDDNRHFDYQTESISFEEIEDLEENI